MPVRRIRLPLPSLAFDTPYCACAEAPHATLQKIANANLICPRWYSGPYSRSGCPEMHSQTGSQAGLPRLANDGIRMGTRQRDLNA
jgi:hypothetical protein